MIRLRRRSMVSTAHRVPFQVHLSPARKRFSSGAQLGDSPLAGRGCFPATSPAVGAAAAAHRQDAIEQRSVPAPIRSCMSRSSRCWSPACWRRRLSARSGPAVEYAGTTIVNRGRGYTWFRVILRTREALGPKKKRDGAERTIHSALASDVACRLKVGSHACSCIIIRSTSIV